MDIPSNKPEQESGRSEPASSEKVLVNDKAEPSPKFFSVVMGPPAADYAKHLQERAEELKRESQRIDLQLEQALQEANSQIGQVSAVQGEIRRRVRNLVLLQICILLAAIAISILVVSGAISSILVSRETQILIVASTVGMGAVLAWDFWRNTPKHKYARVFVSFSYKDKEFVSPLIEALRRHGIHVLDPESTIRVGDDIKARLAELVRSSTHAIVVASPNYEESVWAALELSLFSRRIKVLPVLYKTQEVPSGLEGVRYVKTELISADLIEALVTAIRDDRPYGRRG